MKACRAVALLAVLGWWVAEARAEPPLTEEQKLERLKAQRHRCERDIRKMQAQLRAATSELETAELGLKMAVRRLDRVQQQRAALSREDHVNLELLREKRFQEVEHRRQDLTALVIDARLLTIRRAELDDEIQLREAALKK